MNDLKDRPDWQLIGLTAFAAVAVVVLVLICEWMASPNSRISAHCAGGERYGSCYYWFK